MTAVTRLGLDGRPRPSAKIEAIVVTKLGLSGGSQSASVTRASKAQDLLAQTLEGYRWVNDDGSESAATFAQVQDVQHTIAVDGTARIRMIVQAPDGGQYQFECAKDGTEDWFKVD